MPGKSPHAHERPAWHTPAQRPCTGQRPGAAARPHPRGMSFCPSKAISHPVPKPRLRDMSRAMAPRPSLPTGTLRTNASRPPRNARQKPPERANRPPPTQKAPSRAACGKSARPFLGPPSPQPSTNDSSRRKRNGHPPGAGASSQRQMRLSLPTGTLRANASRPPRNAQQKKVPERASRPHPTQKAPSKAACRKSARSFPGPPSPQPSTNDSSRRKRNGHPPGAGASPQRRTRPSHPAGALRANAFPVPRETRGKSPRREPTDLLQR